MSEDTVLGNTPNFLMKLWTMVEDTSTDEYIQWSESGMSFIIKNPVEFARIVLPMFFKHSNIQSFIRQLNMYGFHKVPTQLHDSVAIEFCHRYFVKGSPEMLTEIKRKGYSCSSRSQSQTAHISHAESNKNGGMRQTELPPTVYQDELSVDFIGKILQDIKKLKEENEHVKNKLSTVKKENGILWRELSILRQKQNHTEINIRQLLQIIATCIATTPPGLSKHNLPMLMLKGAFKNATSRHLSGADRSHYARTNDKNRKVYQAGGPIIHEINNSNEMENSDEMEMEIDEGADLQIGNPSPSMSDRSVSPELVVLPPVGMSQEGTHHVLLSPGREDYIQYIIPDEESEEFQEEDLECAEGERAPTPTVAVVPRTVKKILVPRSPVKVKGAKRRKCVAPKSIRMGKRGKKAIKRTVKVKDSDDYGTTRGNGEEMQNFTAAATTTLPPADPNERDYMLTLHSPDGSAASASLNHSNNPSPVGASNMEIARASPATIDSRYDDLNMKLESMSSELNSIKDRMHQQGIKFDANNLFDYFQDNPLNYNLNFDSGPGAQQSEGNELVSVNNAYDLNDWLQSEWLSSAADAAAGEELNLDDLYLSLNSPNTSLNTPNPYSLNTPNNPLVFEPTPSVSSGTTASTSQGKKMNKKGN